MKRLTERYDGYPYGKPGITIEQALGSECICRGEFEATAIVERLSQYEDTGLTPEEIMDMRQYFMAANDGLSGERNEGTDIKYSLPDIRQETLIYLPAHSNF